MATPVSSRSSSARSLRQQVIDLQEELSHVRQTNAAFFDRALAMLCTAGFDGYFKQLNPMWSRTFGFSEAELMAEPFLSFVHPDDVASTIAAAEQLGAEGRDVISFENRYRCKDGSYRWLRWTSTPDIEQSLIYAVAQDITESRAADDRLRESEARFRDIALNMPGAVFQFTSRNGIWSVDYCSDRVDAIVGISAETMMADITKFIERVHPDDRDAYLTSINQAVEYLTPWHCEGRFLLPNGEVRWWQGDSTPVQKKAGEVLFTGVLMDISNQRQAEDVLRQSLMQEEVIRAQRATLEELSTPLIPISDTVVVMPLIGAVDTRRAQQVLDTLLEGIAQTRAEVAILDITGVPVVDTQVANALIRAAQAVKLLGAQVMLTGIRPEVAQTLVGLGVDLSSIITRGSLQSGIALAMQRR